MAETSKSGASRTENQDTFSEGRVLGWRVRFKIWLKPHSLNLVLFGQATVLVTFIVHEVLRDEQKEKLDAISSAQAIFAINSEIDNSMLTATKRIDDHIAESSKPKFDLWSNYYKDISDHTQNTNEKLRRVVTFIELVKEFPNTRNTETGETSESILGKLEELQTKLSNREKLVSDLKESSIKYLGIELAAVSDEFRTDIGKLDNEEEFAVEHEFSSAQIAVTTFVFFRRTEEVSKYDRYTKVFVMSYLLGFIVGVVGKLAGVEVETENGL